MACRYSGWPNGWCRGVRPRAGRRRGGCWVLPWADAVDRVGNRVWPDAVAVPLFSREGRARVSGYHHRAVEAPWQRRWLRKVR